MRYLIDTNVLSETFKRAPDRKVVRWPPSSPRWICTSASWRLALTMGFELAPAGKRREQLQRWVSQDLAGQFIGRILEVDEAVSREWGKLSAFGRTSGRELPAETLNPWR